ncbi:hypothetical protein [Klebsiella pneumoniae]|nr:hypothetical protein [Klebsiella pneumoniae]MDV5545055.1 hypothetical protein [Klebsiella pneumoniae]
MFDCDVLHIPWSELKVGSRLAEKMSLRSRYYKKKQK